MVITEAEAERVLRAVGLRRHGGEVCRGTINGRPAEAVLSMAGIYENLRPVVGRMLAPIRGLLRDVPAVIGVEVIEDGIFLTGGVTSFSAEWLRWRGT